MSLHSEASREAWFSTRRSLLLGAIGVAGLGAGAAVLEHLWKSKDVSARLFNPFAIDKFELAAVPGLVDAQGNPVPGFSSADLAGRRSLLNVWATWCPSCRAEHPLLMALKERNLAPIYGADVKDRPDRTRHFLARYGNPFTAVGADEGAYLQRALGARGVPATFVVGPGPVIELAIYEPLDERIVEEKIVPALTRT